MFGRQIGSLLTAVLLSSGRLSSGRHTANHSNCTSGPQHSCLLAGSCIWRPNSAHNKKWLEEWCGKGQGRVYVAPTLQEVCIAQGEGGGPEYIWPSTNFVLGDIRATGIKLLQEKCLILSLHRSGMDMLSALNQRFMLLVPSENLACSIETATINFNHSLIGNATAVLQHVHKIKSERIIYIFLFHKQVIFTMITQKQHVECSE